MRWAQVCAVAAIAALLRLPHLSERPMHADEAVLAYKLGTLLEERTWSYDPRDHHGPVLLYATAPAARIAGAGSWRTLTEPILRFVPALAGTALAAVTALAWPVGGLFVALSPAMVFHSVYYIPEMFLVLFTASCVLAVRRYAGERRARWMVLAGIFAGLMYATKETAVIALACLAFAALLRPPAAHLVYAVLAALATAALLLTPAGLVDSVAGLFTVWIRRAIGPSLHTHPPWFYLGLLARTELPILLGAAAAVFIRPRERTLGIFALLMLAVYSLLPYKTPWSIMSAFWALAALAGATAESALRRHPRAAGAVTLAAAAALFWPAPAAVWTYAGTHPDIRRIASDLERFGNGVRVQVISQQNVWPLPWYLRPFPNAGYLREVPPGAPLAPVVLATPEMEEQITVALYEAPPPGKREMYLSIWQDQRWLRPGVELRGFASRRLYE